MAIPTPVVSVLERMPTAAVDALGAAPVIRWTQVPESATGSTQRVAVAPRNPLNLLTASGDFHSARYDHPYVPGSKCVGRVLVSDRCPYIHPRPAAAAWVTQAASSNAKGVIVPDNDLSASTDGSDLP